jgi:hypothetical protein
MTFKRQTAGVIYSQAAIISLTAMRVQYNKSKPGSGGN